MPTQSATYIHFAPCLTCRKIFTDAARKPASRVSCPACGRAAEPLRVVQQITLLDRIPDCEKARAAIFEAAREEVNRGHTHDQKGS